MRWLPGTGPGRTPVPGEGASTGSRGACSPLLSLSLCSCSCSSSPLYTENENGRVVVWWGCSSNMPDIYRHKECSTEFNLSVAISYLLCAKHGRQLLGGNGWVPKSVMGYHNPKRVELQSITQLNCSGRKKTAVKSTNRIVDWMVAQTRSFLAGKKIDPAFREYLWSANSFFELNRDK